MNEILGYFFHPEISMDILLNNNDKVKWRDGILKWVLVAILAGLLTIATYKVAGVDLGSLSTTYYGKIVEELVKSNVNEGVIWLILAIRSIGEILVSAIIRVGLWIGLIYIVSSILKDIISLRQIVNMSIFAILTWISSQVFLNIALCISMISPIQTINEMLIGLGMLLGYWYLILFIIGYSMISRSTFLKGGMVVLVIQGLLWGVSNAVPFLQIFLG